MSLGARGRAALALATVLLAGALAPGAHVAEAPADGHAATAPAAPAPSAGARVDATAAAPPPRARLRVLTRTPAAVLRRGLRVRVRYRGFGGVRLFARVPRRGRRGLRFASNRLVRFRAPERRVARLRLTRAGRRLVAGRRARCRVLRVEVAGRARRFSPATGRPAFGPRGRSRRPRTTRRTVRLRPGGAACRGGAGPSPPGPFRAGAAAADITPPVGTPMFAYTARSGIANPPTSLEDLGPAFQIIADPDENLYAKTFVPSEGIHTRVLARALVIEQRGRKFALVQADLGGLPYALTQLVLRKVADLGIDGERLLLSATHTHSSTGPLWPADSTGYALLGGDLFDPRAFELTAQGIAEAIRVADARLEPARLGSAVVELRGASRNRSFEAFVRNADIPADEAAAREASVDRALTVLRVDAADGRPIAAWSNFAVHPTSFDADNLLFSGDNVATAERVAERGMAAEAAAAGHAPPLDRPPVNVWTNSNEGDISPDGGPDRDGDEELQYVPNAFASANLAGQRVGQGVLRAWRAAGEAMSDSVALDARRTFLAFDGASADGEPVGPLAVLGAGGILADDGFCAPIDNLAGPGQGMKFPAIGGLGLVPQIHPVSVWRVGDLGLVALPSEVTRQMGRRIRDALASRSGGALDSVALAGLTNGYVSYTATPEEYDACRYEGSFTLFGRRQGARFLAVAGHALGALLGGLPAEGAPEPPSLGFGLPNLAPIDATPDAGQVVAQPAQQVRRYERAVFAWRGGDPAIDAPRGRAFVSLQRLVGGGWQTVASDDSESDTTALDGGVWTETWQFGRCDPLGSYRLLVRGVADRGSGLEAYEVASSPLELLPTAPLSAGGVTVAGGVATFTAAYPNPGPDALLALPRRVRSGSATVEVDGQPVDATLDEARLRFRAPAPPGATVEVASVRDGCGNAG